jgi:hypothetical protein
MVGLRQPGLDHLLAALDRIVVGVVAVGDVLSEEGRDLLAVVAFQASI